MIGKVKWFNKTKGYGFITTEEDPHDVFVHISQLDKIGLHFLKEGQRVRFETYDDRGRIAAGNLQILN